MEEMKPLKFKLKKNTLKFKVSGDLQSPSVLTSTKSFMLVKWFIFSKLLRKLFSQGRS